MAADHLPAVTIVSYSKGIYRGVDIRSAGSGLAAQAVRGRRYRQLSGHAWFVRQQHAGQGMHVRGPRRRFSGRTVRIGKRKRPAADLTIA